MVCTIDRMLPRKCLGSGPFQLSEVADPWSPSIFGFSPHTHHKVDKYLQWMKLEGAKEDSRVSIEIFPEW